MKKDPINKMICGVCSGMAKEFEVDVTLIRLAFAILTVMGFGLPLIIYIVMAIVMPEE